MRPYYADESVTLYHGDALGVLRGMPDASVDCCVTSPPYFGLRDYGDPGQYGLEATPAEYVERLRVLFAEVWRVVADDGTVWLNLGDSYASRSDGYNRGANYEELQPRVRPRVAGEVPKSVRGIPWRTALALQADGWILRSPIVWYKVRPNGRPVADRPMVSYELVFLFVKQRFYYYQAAAADTDHDVWSIATDTPPGVEHVAPMPSRLATKCITRGCRSSGTVLDPFSGSGTTGLAALKQGRRYVGIDLNRDYLDLSLRTRLAQSALLDTEGGT